VTNLDVKEGDIIQSFCVMLDAMAERYNYLPSEVLARATTLDIQIFDIANKHKTLAQERAKDPNYKPVPKMRQEDLAAMLARVRAKDGSKT